MFHFDSQNDIARSVEAAGEMRLAGCVNNVDVLLNGSSKDVAKQVKAIAAGGIRLIGLECALPLRVKNENLAAIAATVKGLAGCK